MRYASTMLALTVLACAQQPSEEVAQAGSPTDAAAVRAEIDRTNVNISRWIAEGRVDSIAAAYAADGWVQGPNMKPVAGRDSIAAMWGGMMKMGKFRLTPRAQDVTVSGDMAVERGTYEMSFERPRNAPAGTPPSFTDRGSYIVVWVKQGDRWLLKWDIGSSELPPGGATAK